MKYKAGDKVKLLQRINFGGGYGAFPSSIHTVYIGKPGDFLNETKAFVKIGQYSIIIDDAAGHNWAYSKGYFEKVGDAFIPTTEADYYKWLANRF